MTAHGAVQPTAARMAVGSRGLELLMAMWNIPDVWLESAMSGMPERAGITNELALAVNPSLMIVPVSTSGHYGKEECLGRPATPNLLVKVPD